MENATEEKQETLDKDGNNVKQNYRRGGENYVLKKGNS